MSIFGEKLRRQRELLDISLEAISNSTKISPRMLRAIEDEHFDRLPGGVFNKGFVRAYARYVNLDEEEAVAGYLAALRESQIQGQVILPTLRPTPSPKPGHALERSPSPAQADGRVDNDDHADPNHTGHNHAIQNPTDDSRLTHTVPGVPHKGAARGIPWKRLGLPALALVTIVVFPLIHHRRTPSGGAVQATSTPSRLAAAPSVVSVAEPRAAAGHHPAWVSAIPDKRATKTVRLTTPAKFTLLIRATQTSWISVAADGQLLARETLIAPAHTSVRASREIVVKAGNAAGINFLLNGKNIPARGEVGQVRTYTFDASGLHDSVAVSSSPAN